MLSIRTDTKWTTCCRTRPRLFRARHLINCEGYCMPYIRCQVLWLLLPAQLVNNHSRNAINMVLCEIIHFLTTNFSLYACNVQNSLFICIVDWSYCVPLSIFLFLNLHNYSNVITVTWTRKVEIWNSFPSFCLICNICWIIISMSACQMHGKHFFCSVASRFSAALRRRRSIKCSGGQLQQDYPQHSKVCRRVQCCIPEVCLNRSKKC